MSKIEKIRCNHYDIFRGEQECNSCDKINEIIEVVNSLQQEKEQEARE